MHSDRVYLDHNASSTLRPEALEAMQAVLEDAVGHPSEPHAEGRRSREILASARRQLSALAAVPPESLVFTSGGSEALAMAIRGVCDRAPREMCRIVVSSIEHRAVLEAVELAAERGFVVVKVPCTPTGRVDVARFLLHVEPGVALAALQWANSETGVIQPVEEIGRVCRDRGVPFLVDAAAAAGKLELDPRRVHADLMAISAHKLGGPQGTGALYIRPGLALTPLISGTGPDARRGGMPAVAALAGFGAAASAAHREFPRTAHRLLPLRARIESRLRDRFPQIRYHGEGVTRLCNTLNFAIPGVPGAMLVHELDRAGFALSTAGEAVRVSLGWSTKAGEVDRFTMAMPDIVATIREQVAKEADE
jgi:cysteine desulfurase